MTNPTVPPLPPCHQINGKEKNDLMKRLQIRYAAKPSPSFIHYEIFTAGKLQLERFSIHGMVQLSSSLRNYL